MTNLPLVNSEADDLETAVFDYLLQIPLDSKYPLLDYFFEMFKPSKQRVEDLWQAETGKYIEEMQHARHLSELASPETLSLIEETFNWQKDRILTWHQQMMSCYTVALALVALVGWIVFPEYLSSPTLVQVLRIFFFYFALGFCRRSRLFF